MNNEELEELATDEQKQMAAAVAIDSYDKSETYFEELRNLVRCKYFER